MKYEAGTKVSIIADGGYTWLRSRKRVYGVVQNNGKIRLYDRKTHKPASVYNEAPRPWFFSDSEVRKMRDQSRPEAVK